MTNIINERNKLKEREKERMHSAVLYMMVPLHSGKNKTDSEYKIKTHPCLISEKAKICYRGSFETETPAWLHEL
jgi:hypothetical protein